MHTHVPAACWWMVAWLLACPLVQAQGVAESLADLSIEQLLNESVTSVTKRRMRQVDSPAAISVLSNDDIQRSGATTLADAMRLVPGMNVGAVNANQYAVSARGFNGVFANKMLVLVDGRAVYNSLFAGVFWDLQQPMLEDLDRIEAIRGPGAAVWGANAMNGVINVVSRSAKETQGGYAYLGGGNVREAMAGGRYGGMIGDDIYYRVFASYKGSDDYLLSGDRAADDGWHAWHGGMRLDQDADSDTHLTWQADATVLNLDDGASDAYNFNTLGRWTRQLSGRSSLEFQAYYDRSSRNEMRRASATSETFDLTVQHSFGMGADHDIMWGVGYRFVANSVIETTRFIGVRDSDFDLNLFSLFVQDEWKVVPDKLIVTAGARLEHNDYTGFEIQPSLRAVLKATDKQTLWAAVSRAVRTPSAVEGRDALAIPFGAPILAPGGPYVPTIVGSGAPEAEVLWAYELGYRAQPHQRVSVDAAGFYNHYTDLFGIGSISRFIPGVPTGIAELPFDNNVSAETYGGEVSVTVAPSDAWRLSAAYSLLLADFHGPASANPEGMERNIPTHQVVLRSSYDFSKRVSLDWQIRYVDQIESVPAYVTADVRVLYRVSERLELSVAGQNLFADQHLEQPTQVLTVTAQVPRGVYGKITWRF